MLEFLDLYIGCSFTGILFWIAGIKLFKAKEKVSKFKLILSILIVGLVASLLNLYAVDTLTSIIKIMIVCIVLCMYYAYIFKISISDSITVGFLTYLCTIISDVSFGIIIAIIEKTFNIDAMLIYNNKILVNFIIYSLSYLIILKNEKKFIELVDSTDFNKKVSSVITILTMFTIALLGFKIPLSEWKLTVDFIITMIITISLCIIGIYILKQKSEIRKTSLKYQKLVDYSDITNSLLEDYRIVSHEHKNQLSIIRGMVKSSNKELLEYIDDLLEKRNIIKYQWIGELNYLPLSGLKGLINYKIMEMEKSNLNISIIISKEISKTKLNKLNSKQKDNLYSIIGIYLDNAIQASQNSNDKEISLEIYKNKQKIILVLANTYKGKINLEKMDDYGFTTKGKNHGIGLYIVKKILEESKIFTQKRNVVDKYFIQELEINLEEVK